MSRGQGIELQIKGYRLALAEIVYHMPDHPGLLQTFIWQHLDLAPEYPELHNFLKFWQDNLDGALHSVRVAHRELIKPAEFRASSGVFQLH